MLQAMSKMDTNLHVRQVRVGALGLPGEFVQVPAAMGVCVFAHGSGSSHRSVRNRQVAHTLHGYQLSTLLFDLLTEPEADDRAKVFDIPLLAGRLVQALNWLEADAVHGQLPVGLFGASTGAGAALVATAAHPGRVAAVVSRGGRPDLANHYLEHVRAPTLLIVGGLDVEVLRLNREAMRLMHCQTRLEVVPGATHLFEEPGAMETVAHLAGSWFAHHLAGAPHVVHPSGH